MKNFKTVILYIILLFINKIVLADVDGLPPIKPIPPEKVIEITAPHKVNIDLPKKDYGTFRYIGDGKIQLNKQQFNQTSTTGNTATATKTNPVRLTDDYGNTATGKIQTETKIPKSNINRAVNAYVAANVAGSVVNSSHAEQAVKEMAAGNYDVAALQAAAALDFTGLGDGFNKLKEAWQKAQEEKAEAVAERVEKDKQEAQKAYDPKIKQIMVIFTNDFGQGSDYIQGVSKIRKVVAPAPDDFGGYANYGGYLRYWKVNEDGSRTEFFRIPKEEFEGKRYIKDKIFANDPKFYQPKLPTAEEIMLNQTDLQNTTNMYLERLLKEQQENNEELRNLTNALWANGGLNPGNTQTQVVGGDGANTFTTTPYTPIGSDVAQQTQFIIHNNGNVTTNIVKRADLAANTSQAPTRQQVGQDIASTRPQTQAPKESASASAPDMCAMNPNSFMCAQVGNVDYEDLSLPEKKIELKFEPSDIFNSDGTCPAPKVFNVMNKQFSISYEPICDFARGARPMVILLGMVISMGMAYAAVKEI